MTGEIITMYLPIFEEKLAKLEARGHGQSEEANRLRKAIQWAVSAPPTSPGDNGRVAA